MELEALGFNREFAAQKLKTIAETGKPKEKLDAVRLYASLKGDIKDERGAANIVNTGPVMVIVGANASKINALRKAEALPTKEELEQIENQRCQQRLEELRSGKTFVKRLQENNEQPLADSQSSPEQLHPEVEPAAG